MKIKKTVEMDLLELLTWAKDNGKTGDFYGVDEDYRVFISHNFGWVQTDNGRKIPTFDTKFKVEIEENITENTEFDNLKWTYLDLRTNDIMTNGWENRSINETLISERRCDDIEVLAIYSCDKNGILTLIWTKDNGLVLE